ncbi:MAG: hypothetical protein ACRDV9_01040 [Acidimicrobiia bacterium]
MKVVDASNLADTKLSILLQGHAGGGKTSGIFSLPEPIVACYADPHDDRVAGLMKGGRQITLYIPEDWGDFEQKFVPMVVNREFDAESIVVDSWPFLAMMLMRTPGIGNAEGVVTPTDTGKRIQIWGAVSGHQQNMLLQLASARVPIPGKRNYNLGVTTHLTEVFKGEGEKRQLIGYRPDIPGGFKDEFTRCFGAALICQAVTETTIEGTPPQTKRNTRYRVWSVPPTDLYEAKDSIAGPSTPYKALPPVMDVAPDGLYNTLRRAWGMETPNK